MTPALKQLRDGTAASIKRNPTRVQFFSGGSLRSELVRLTHESVGVPANKPSPVGLSTSFSMFVQLRHDSDIAESDVLIESGRGWKVGAVDELKVNGAVYAKRAALVVQKLGTTNSIKSFKIGSVYGTISEVTGTINIILPLGTDVTALSPSIIHDGKVIDKTGAQDFTSPVAYTVTAENLKTKIYVATVVIV